MKMLISILYILFVLAACNIIESTGLTKDSYTGGEAREKIRDAAFNGDGIYYEKKYGGYSGLVFSKSVQNALMVSVLLDLDDSKYYNKDKVNDCVSDIEKFSYLNRLDSVGTLTLSENCRNFKEIGFFPK
ncbi:TIGR04452 family lipoprotein [Leptospira andrefontaineae]|uniref:TIGR04452 family lipoprotein n=1 Tax=Leptospira andrefontaineae TaxID=2484976 RepID=A0A4V3JGF8_9LEPT|nr:TIGR04452 family lipoprotein [Leptospira andrefontaineae]TGK42413.1 TIGR04452 family lipoprotein [Leptospira andrefontaineae]